MARNTNKRVATKHIRDGIKSNYQKKDRCEICGAVDNLELHHYTTVSLLLKQYAKENGIPISTDKEVLAMRDDFYKLYWHELVEDTVTLCNKDHTLLHQIYSQEPPLHTANKQKQWVKARAAKEEGVELVSEPSNVNLSEYKVFSVGLGELKV